MGNIELPTYKTIVTNEIFGRKAEPLNHPLIGKVDATQILRLTRFKVPTQDEVIEFIKASAQKIDLSWGNGSSDKDPNTTYFLKLFPASEIKNIAGENKDSLQHLRRHYPNSDLQEGRAYIQAISGVVPDKILNEARELMKQKGSVIYERAIERTGAKEWNLRVRLLENGRFPDSLELEYLMDRGVRRSDVFSAHGNFGDYQNVANQIRILYNVLNSPDLITQIGDSSYHFLEQKAGSTVGETAQCIAARNAVGGLIEIIERKTNECEIPGNLDKKNNWVM